MEYFNSELGNRLLERKRLGQCREVRHATPTDLGSFRPERSKCHDNVDRWCEQHRGHKPRRGWLLSGTVFDRHSVVELGGDQLLDITPLGDSRPYSLFLPYDGTQSEFDELPNQVVTIDLSQSFA